MNYSKFINMMKDEITEDKETLCWDERTIENINKKEKVIELLEEINDCEREDIW